MDRAEVVALVKQEVGGVPSLIRQLQDRASGITEFAKTLLDDADASSALSTLGVSTFIKTLLDDTDAATARATLGALAVPGSYAARAGAAFNTTYQPSASRPTHVIANVTIDVDAGEEGRVNVKVGAASPPTAIVGLLDVFCSGTREIVAAPITFMVPAGQNYRVETQNVGGAPSFGINSFQELTL